MRNSLLIVAGLACSLAARADFSGSAVLQTNMALSLDSGAAGSVGADLLWTGTSLAPQGSARAYATGNGSLGACYNQGAAYFGNFTKSATSAPVPLTKLDPGNIVTVVTNGGHTAGLCVVSSSGGVLSLIFATFGTAGVAGQPVVNQIMNNSSAIPPFYPNYGIAPSSIFIVTGSNLADAGDPVLQSSAAPGIPLKLNGASIDVTVKGVTTHPALYYTSPGQLAAVLPAATPVGTGTLTVTYSGKTSAPTPIVVVPAALGINSYSGNLAVATDAVTGALFTFNNSAAPGQTIVLWTTGLGADPADSDTVFSSSPQAVNTPIQVYVGGVPASILYAGSAGYPGVVQINLTLPDNSPTGCWVSVSAVAGGVVSNSVMLPINRGGGSCFDSIDGVSGDQFSPTNGGQTLRAGTGALIHSVNGTKTPAEISDSTSGAFVKYTGVYVPANSLSPGSCRVGPPVPSPQPKLTFLKAGQMTITGPNGLSVAAGPAVGITGTFFSALKAGSIVPGTYTFTTTGGADVGPFTASVTFADPLLQLTIPNTSIVDRSKAYTVTWTGGNPGTYVYINGASRSALGIDVTFECIVPVDDKQFTVPSYVLQALPAGTGGISAQNIFYTTFSATGLDVGSVGGDVFYSGPSATFQ